MQVKRLLAYAVAALAVLQAAVGWVWVALAADGMGAAFMAIATVLGFASVALGVVVATKRPDNLVGALLAWVGLMPVAIASSDAYAEAFIARPDVVPVSAFLLSLDPGSWMFLYVPPALLALLFPDGRLPDGRRWRVLAAALIVVPVLFMFVAAFDPEPFPAPFTGVPHAFRAGLAHAGAAGRRVWPAADLPGSADRHRRVRRGPAPPRGRSGTPGAGQVVRAGWPVRPCHAAGLLAELPAHRRSGSGADRAGGHVPGDSRRHRDRRAAPRPVRRGPGVQRRRHVRHRHHRAARLLHGRDVPGRGCAGPRFGGRRGGRHRGLRRRPGPAAAPGCSAGSTAGSTRSDRPRWPRSRTCRPARTPVPRSPSSWRPPCGRRCATRTCGSATGCRGRATWWTAGARRCG